MSKSSLSSRWGRLWTEWIRPLLVVVAVLGSFRSAVADWNDVPSGSMRPTILEGERIFVNKLAYSLRVPFTPWHVARWARPQRGEIVVFFSPHDEKRLVKRIVGVPGDRLEFRGRRLLLNGEEAAYSPAGKDDSPSARAAGAGAAVVQRERVAGYEHLVSALPSPPPYPDFGPVTVPPGKYFLVGDSRDTSFDSRFWGFVDEARIVGRAVAVVVSVDRPRSFWPRWSRFFTALS
jgi:signal peptidase I